MAEPNGNKEKRQLGAFKSAFCALSPKSETRLAGLDGLSRKFSQWEKYLQGRHELAGRAEGRLSANARKALNIASAKAEFAEGKLCMKIGATHEKANENLEASEQYWQANSHFSKAEEMRKGAGLLHGIEAGMRAYAAAKGTLAGRLLGIGDTAEILKTTPDEAVKFVSDAVREMAAEFMTEAIEHLLGDEKEGRVISKLPVAKIGIEAGGLFEYFEEKEKASEIYVKTGDWCAREEKYSDASVAYKKAAAVNPLMAKNYLSLAGQMDTLSRVAGRIKSV